MQNRVGAEILEWDPEISIKSLKICTCECDRFSFCKRQAGNSSSGEKTKRREMANCLCMLKCNKNNIDYKSEVNIKTSKEKVHKRTKTGESKTAWKRSTKRKKNSQ